MPPVNLAIIGTGIAARKLHWPALKQLTAEFRPVQVCNHTEPKARKFANLVGGVPFTTDYRKVLANPLVEAVDIALPIPLSYPVTLAALEAGKHVIVEKPLAANLEEARLMLDFPARFPRQVMLVAENFRYAERFLVCAEIISSGAIGRPYAVLWNILQKMDFNNEYARTTWRIEHQYPGGFITDGGVHQIAALRDLCGEIIAGRALTDRINPAIGAVDTFSFQFTTDRKVNGVLNIMLSVAELAENVLKIMGTAGSIILDDIHLRAVRADGTVIVDDVYADPGYRGEFADFYRAIRAGKQPVSTFARAYGDLATILTALDGSLPRP